MNDIMTDVVLGDRLGWTISRVGSVVAGLGNDKSVGEIVALECNRK